jgi:hypothetical protein
MPTDNSDLSFDPNDPPPNVRRWMARMQRALDAAPIGVWVYVDSGNFTVMAQTKEGERLRLADKTTFDQRAVVETLPSRLSIDGGDW